MPTPSPYTILALAPFGPVPAIGYKPRIVEVDLFSMDEALSNLGPRFWVELPKDVCPAGGVDVTIGSLAGFKPENVVKNTPYLAGLSACRQAIAQARSQNAAPDQLAASIRQQWPGLPLDLSLPHPDAVSPAANAGAIDDILDMVATGGQQAGAGSGGAGPAGLAGWQAQAETLLARALSAIFADAQMRTYESAWRGVECLARQARVKEGGRVRLQLCSASPESLEDALGALTVELALSTPHLTLIDQGFDNSPASIELLGAVAAFADTLLAPTAVWLSQAFFRIGSWREMSKLGYLKHALEDAAYAKWRKLRETPGASRLMVMLNAFLARPPFGPDVPARPVVFTEAAPLWVSPVWALGALAAKSVAGHGWPTRFTDYMDIRLEGLAVADGGDGFAATQGLFDENRIAELLEAGMTPVVGGRGKDIAMLPRQTSLDGGSFVFQLFFGRVVSHLLEWREQAGDGESDPASSVRKALVDLFNQTDQVPPVDLTVDAAEKTEGRVPLTISFTPPRQVMGGQRLTFEFGW